MNAVCPSSAPAEQVVAAIRAVVGEGPVALHEPSFAGNEWLYLKECLDSTFVSSVGKFVDRWTPDKRISAMPRCMPPMMQAS